MRRRITVGSLMAAVAVAGGLLASYRGGQVAQQLATPPPPAPPPTVYVTPRGKHYHTASCRYALRGSPVALESAARRYEPCAYCRPPSPPVPDPPPAPSE